MLLSISIFHRLLFLGVLFLMSATVFAQNIVDPTEVDIPPYMSSCKNIDKEMQKTCSDKSLLNYLYNNMKYPEVALKNKKEGMVVLQFVVDKNGQIKDEKVARSSGSDALDASALALILAMKSNSSLWQPAYKEGKAVSTYLKLPVKFKLK
ncbi:MAG: energy transducer TonB [Aureispira sp.]